MSSTTQEDTETRGARGAANDLVADARRLASDASSFADDARRLGGDLRQMITDSPLRAIGMAVGAGFVVAGGLSPAVLRSVTGLAGRLAMVVITKRLIATLDDRVNNGNEPSRERNDSRTSRRPSRPRDGSERRAAGPNSDEGK